MMMEAALSSETSVYNKSTRRYIPKDGILHGLRRENLKSHIVKNYKVKKIKILSP
jgi:hypothetical protein